jgi:malonate-semialdehyde dehydrogenase (acetylating)/methylmalonate-semialdehyde dehydrogenase
MTTVASIIGDEETAQGRLVDVTNPATGAVLRQVAAADARLAERAVDCARAAFPGWRDTPPAVRARFMVRFRDLLERRRDALAELILEEHGKPIGDALGSIQRGLEVVEYALAAPQLLKGEYSDAVATGVSTRSSRQPLGVCVGITPFNYPAMIPLWMFPLALVCGNTFVLKPSEKAPSAANFLAGLLAEAGVPPGVFNVLHGGSEAASALIAHPAVAAVSFVGSSAVAAAVYASAAAVGKRVQALGGAKNHAIVLADANLDAAIDGLLNGAFNSAGQRCMAVSVAVVVDPLGDEFVARLVERSRALRTGPGSDPATYVPPLAAPDLFRRVVGYIETGIAEGARLVLDGRDPPRDPAYANGYFVGPTIFDDVAPTMRIYREEIFGPVLCVMRAPDLDAAIALSNGHGLANGAVLFTDSGAAAARFEQRIECGMPGINVPVPSPVAYHSFGGWNGSIFGPLAAHGPDAINFYTRRRTLSARWP